MRLKLTERAVSILDIHNRFHEEMIERLLNELELDKEVELIQSLRNLMEFLKENTKACSWSRFFSVCRQGNGAIILAMEQEDEMWDTGF